MGWSSNLGTTNQYIIYQIGIIPNSQDIVNNTSNVTVQVWAARTNSGYTTYGSGTVYCRINGSLYSASIVPSQKITDSGIYLFSQTVVIPHNADGTKTLTCSAWISHDRFSSSEQSYSQTLTTIPRKSLLSASNGTLNTAQTLTVTKYASSFTHTITYVCGSYNGTICTKSSSTSISWTPPLTLANSVTNGTSVYISLKIETFNGSTSLGSNSYSITCTIPTSVVPTVTFTLGDAMGYLSTYGSYVQSKSKFNIVVSAAGIYGSTISSYAITADGKTYSGSSVVTNVINGTGTLTITVKVTDSRGRTATASKTANVLAYNSPSITSLTVKRSDSAGNSNSSGAYLTVLFNSTITSLNSKNTAKYIVKYKKSSATTYTSATVSAYAGKYVVTNGMYVFAADTASSYDVILEVTDAFSTSSKTGSGSSITKLWSAMKKGLGFAFGKVAEVENALDIAWNTYVRKNLYVTGNTSVSGTATVTGDLTAKNIKPRSSGDVYDRQNTVIRNGLSYYTGSGTAAVDPNTTNEHLILTNKNTPMGSDKWMYIHTFFYNGKGASNHRAQIAIPYNQDGSMYHRYYTESWSAWKRHVNEDDTTTFARAVASPIRIVSGTVIRSFQAGKNWALVHTFNEVLNLFGVSGISGIPNANPITAVYSQGDTYANNMQYYTASYWGSPDNAYYVVFNQTASAAGACRVNYAYILNE